MTTTGISRCPSCKAMVNAHWSTCPACRASFDGIELMTEAEKSVADWLKEWKSMAQMTAGLSGEDPRYPAVLAGLAACEVASRAEDLAAFRRETQSVKRLLTFVHGALVQWKDERKRVRGPAPVLDLTFEDGRLWVWVEWEGHRWISENIIASITHN